MKPHELDVVSLLAGLVFLVLGGVGLLRAAGVIDSGAPWAVIGAIGTVGLVGVVVSIRRLAQGDRTGPMADPPAEAPAEPVVSDLDDTESGISRS